MHILLVEDDDLVASGVASALEAEGFTLDRFPDARRADAALRAAHTDAVILDLGLPDTDGMKLLRDWRASALFGTEVATVKAHRLLDGEFVRQLAPRRLTLWEPVFDDCHILYADGLEVASAAD